MPLHMMLVVVGVDPCDCHVALQRGKWNRGRHRHSHGGLTENMPEPPPIPRQSGNKNGFLFGLSLFSFKVCLDHPRRSKEGRP